MVYCQAQSVPFGISFQQEQGPKKTIHIVFSQHSNQQNSGRYHWRVALTQQEDGMWSFRLLDRQLQKRMALLQTMESKLLTVAAGSQVLTDQALGELQCLLDTLMASSTTTDDSPKVPVTIPQHTSYVKLHTNRVLQDLQHLKRPNSPSPQPGFESTCDSFTYSLYDQQKQPTIYTSSNTLVTEQQQSDPPTAYYPSHQQEPWYPP
ncbi:hypothetical protein BC941DRAFT_166855 [Chlamydoabsidia padenii]|nr:hypothetical protein BC941DRAFT_166855 [Chlamydoabsidia padenii]